MNYPCEMLASVFSRRGLQLHHIETTLSIPGSPERCRHRLVATDTNGAYWLAEHLTYTQQIHRNRIGRLLYTMFPQSETWIPLPALLTGTTDCVEQQGEPWQLSPFYQGEELPRPAYLHDAWRGSAVGNVIINLQYASSALITIPNPTIEDAVNAHQHHIEHYIEQLGQTIKRHHPSLYQRIAPSIRHCCSVLPDSIEAQGFTCAHGDLHPLNIIWSHNALCGVIDWEFCGKRPLLYDVANCLGCCGFEHPSGLVKNFAVALTSTLTQHHGSAIMQLLPDMVLASRFSWLSEWFRKNDAEMLHMELEYMDILMDNRDYLSTYWSTKKAQPL